MALRAVSLRTKFEGADAWHFTGNSLKRLAMPCFMGHFGSSIGRPLLQLRCSLSSKSVPSMESEETPPDLMSTSTEEEEEDYDDDDEEEGHVTRFKMSDFQVLDYVSTGLGGRADEVVFEALVKNIASPLHNSRVVLRQLTSAQAQRRGRRAMEVLKKLARRRMLYHSYSMQVHGYVSSNASVGWSSFTLVHGYHGSFSLRHWLQQSDWLPTLEATLALDEESVRKVGEDSVGGPAVSRQLRIIRILMRDLLICVNYLHSHGLAHTELRLENVHISPVDRHIKVGILGNAADFYEDSSNGVGLESNMDRREMMIAFDIRCVGFMMAKMVLRELMDPSTFSKFKSFFMKGNDPACLREFLLRILNRSSPSGHVGLQMLDRNWGAGWNLLSLLLATKPSKRISCLDALRHPFLCGPRWRVIPSLDFIRWGLGSTAVRIIEEYIYGQPQRDRLAHFVELMEMLNPHSRPRNWLQFLPGKWRLLYSTSRHIGLTLRQPSVRVLIDDAHLTITKQSNASLSVASEISFRAMTVKDWPLDKSGINGKVQVNSAFRLKAGRRLYLKEEETKGRFFFTHYDSGSSVSVAEKLSSSKWKKAVPFKEPPSSLPVIKLLSGDMDITMSLGEPMQENVKAARKVLRELRVQIPPEMFDLSKLVCGTYVDGRMLVVRSVSGSALLFTRSVN